MKHIIVILSLLLLMASSAASQLLDSIEKKINGLRWGTSKRAALIYFQDMNAGIAEATDEEEEPILITSAPNNDFTGTYICGYSGLYRFTHVVDTLTDRESGAVYDSLKALFTAAYGNPLGEINDKTSWNITNELTLTLRIDKVSQESALPVNNGREGSSEIVYRRLSVVPQQVQQVGFMKYLAFIFLFLLLALPCIGQIIPVDSTLIKAVRQQAEETGQLLINRDYHAFVSHTHPRLVKMMGGEKKMIEVLEAGMKKLQSEGTTITGLTVGYPSMMITANREIQCTVPIIIEMKVEAGRLLGNGTMVAISKDKGKKWYFIDVGRNDLAALQKLIPNLSNQLVIPEWKEPVLLKK